VYFPRVWSHEASSDETSDPRVEILLMLCDCERPQDPQGGLVYGVDYAVDISAIEVCNCQKHGMLQ
jgi:hypothetical protein